MVWWWATASVCLDKFTWCYCLIYGNSTGQKEKLWIPNQRWKQLPACNALCTVPVVSHSCCATSRLFIIITTTTTLSLSSRQEPDKERDTGYWLRLPNARSPSLRLVHQPFPKPWEKKSMLEHNNSGSPVGLGGKQSRERTLGSNPVLTTSGGDTFGRSFTTTSSLPKLSRSSSETVSTSKCPPILSLSS